MIDASTIDYSAMDRPEILTLLFHPRPEWGQPGPTTLGKDVMITVEHDVAVGARFHVTAEDGPTILFFHGNGEIVADYDEIGPLYNRMGVNFLAADYRGYGRSNGTPTVTAVMRDSHAVFNFATTWLRGNGYSGPLIVMGRSLGSAPALELASRYASRIDALIIESGFASTGLLLRILGIDLDSLGFCEELGFENHMKIQRFPNPTLIIHAEQDHLIPFSEGRALYDACTAPGKTLLPIPGANHNTIFARGLDEYLSAVRALTGSIAPASRGSL